MPSFRIAVIGSGPSGFYAADYLLNQKQDTGLTFQIDMFDRLPTPFGLVRGGVAPDHAKIKSVTKVYDKIAAHPNFRFFGNVNFGTDLTRADIERYYHAAIFAVGAQTDKMLGIPGETLAGSHAATEFVGWYNGHPDYVHYNFDLTQETAVVIGVGNVAMDVARILARGYDDLRATDIADYALEALKESRVTTIYVLGRRGPAQAAFTNPEIKELGEIENADLIIEPREIDLDPLSKAYLESPDADTKDVKNVDIMRNLSQRAPSGKPRQIIMRFLTSPVEIIGTDKVEAIKLVRNQLVARSDGSLSARATDETEIIPAGLVFRSVGYYGVALPEIPFDERGGVIPNAQGRIMADGATLPGLYCVGWIKRGPSGIIGTNKPDSIETAKLLLDDALSGALLTPEDTDPACIEDLLMQRGVAYVTYIDWQRLDELERYNGETAGRPRVKFTKIADMLDALRTLKPTE
jgi:ferredoxin--NADP+ reductase